MNRLSTLSGRAAFIATLAFLPVIPISSLPAAAPAAPAPITLTAHDVDVSNAKVRSAYGALVSMWTREFQQIGARFAAPRIARYRGAVRTGCGVMAPSNASYCLDNNTIYYDDVFVAAQAKMAAQALNTDGDMAAI